MDNYALYNGGAVYSSNVNITVDNTKFCDNYILLSNEGYSRGSALFVDNGHLKVEKCNFTDNFADEGAICLYGSSYNISNCLFKNNIENIYSIFDADNTSIDDNDFIDGSNSLNNSEYLYVYESQMTPIEYDPIVFDDSLANSSRFDLRDYGLVSPVRAQGWMGSCWTFGTAAAMESAILKATNKKISLDISENNIQNNGLKYSIYGGGSTEGNSEIVAASYFTSWLGIISSDDDSYDELGKISPIIENDGKYYVFDVIMLPEHSDRSVDYIYKNAIIKYGALATSVYGADGGQTGDYDEKTASAYMSNNTGLSDHVVAIVGWDDNYKKENFIKTPPGDGAWIIKNSWGTKWGDEGFYYLSYYDALFAKTPGAIAFVLNNDHNYTKNYEYTFINDITFKQNQTRYNEFIKNMSTDEIFDHVDEIKKINENNNDPVTYANTYTAIDDDLLGAIGTWFNKEGVDYSVTILVDNEVKYIQTGKSSHSGYETIKLDKPVPIKENTNFTVKILSNACPVADSRNHIRKNMTFADYSGKWIDLTSLEENEVPVIKAYTIEDNSYVITDNIITHQGSGEYVQARYYDQNGQSLANTSVYYMIDDKIYNTTTDDEGYATLNASLAPGRYSITLVSCLIMTIYMVAMNSRIRQKTAITTTSQ